jgi:hypothetical protein
MKIKKQKKVAMSKGIIIGGVVLLSILFVILTNILSKINTSRSAKAATNADPIANEYCRKIGVRDGRDPNSDYCLSIYSLTKQCAKGFTKATYSCVSKDFIGKYHTSSCCLDNLAVKKKK